MTLKTTMRYVFWTQRCAGPHKCLGAFRVSRTWKQKGRLDVSGSEDIEDTWPDFAEKKLQR